MLRIIITGITIIVIYMSVSYCRTYRVWTSRETSVSDNKKYLSQLMSLWVGWAVLLALLKPCCCQLGSLTIYTHWMACPSSA